MKRVLLVIAILAGLPTCVPWVYLPTTPPQMMTVNLPVAPEAAYVKARQAVAAMGGHILNYDDTVRMAFAQVPGPVVLNIAVLPDRNGASVQVIGHVRSTHPEGVAWRELQEYAAVLRQSVVRE
jgi:hypothetical protein